MADHVTEPAPSPAELADRLVSELRAHANPANVAGMERYGISLQGTLGVAMPAVRKLASETKRQLPRDAAARHAVAGLLWECGIHEARIVASLVDDPTLVGDAQMETWAADLDSWDVCDTLCNNLFRKTELAWPKAAEWPARDEEFVKRAGFVLSATLAVHDKPADDTRFVPLLRLAELECTDSRNFVKKAVNWQLRQIGKRSPTLNAEAIAACERILASHPESAPARWVARGALRELRSEAVQRRFRRD